jgi:hypothetical protein
MYNDDVSGGEVEGGGMGDDVVGADGSGRTDRYLPERGNTAYDGGLDTASASTDGEIMPGLELCYLPQNTISRKDGLPVGYKSTGRRRRHRRRRRWERRDVPLWTHPARRRGSASAAVQNKCDGNDDKRDPDADTDGNAHDRRRAKSATRMGRSPTGRVRMAPSQGEGKALTED